MRRRLQILVPIALSSSIACARGEAAPTAAPAVVVPSPSERASAEEGDPAAHPTAREPSGAGTNRGRLPPEVIQRIIRQNYGIFRACYEAGLAKQSDLEGRVIVRFVIERDGSVSDVRDERSTIPDPDVVACVIGSFGKLKFPEPDGGFVTVVYPIMFSPG
jgi:TonB family protein